MPTPLIGFVPDLPVTTPGAIVDCVNLVPSTTGFESAPGPIEVMGVGPLASACRGGAIGENTLGVRRMFAGTQTKLYSYGAAVWDDVSRVGDYTGGTDSRWSFAQFGDSTIAANGVEKLQASNTGDFADIAAAPVAKIVIAAANFVMAFNTIDGTYGTRPDAWWCSGIFDHTTWAPSISTQANTGRLVAAGGAITAALPFGEQVVAYKGRAMWLGSYVGGTAVWQWQQVQGEIGCVGQEAVCDALGVHVFVGDDNIWMYDGVRPRPIADGSVRQWFIDNSSPLFRSRTIVTYERRNNRVWIFFPSQGSTDGTPDRTLVYHMVTGKWGRADMLIEAAVTFIQPGITFDTLDTVAATFDDLPDVSYDSAYWIAGSRSLAIFNSAHQIQTLTGPGLQSNLQLWDIGDNVAVTHLDRFIIQFNTAPTFARLFGLVRDVSGGRSRATSNWDIADGQFKPRQSARWHVLVIGIDDYASFGAVDYSLKPVGLR